jgi:hypothetical protein
VLRGKQEPTCTAQEPARGAAASAEQIEAYLDKPNMLAEIAKSGAEKANESANKTIEELRDTLGLTRKFLNTISK